ncbi:MAG: hypothetical protein ABEJ56_05870 [Candidatus Nanohaloarchaea archaeon]
MVIFAIFDILGDGDIARSLTDAPEMRGKDPLTGGAEAAERGGRAGEKAVEGARKTKGVYNNLSQKGAKQTAKESFYPEDLMEKAGKLKNTLSGEGAAGEAATGEAATLTTNPAGWVVLVMVLIAIGIFILQLGIVVFFMFTIAKFWLPIVGGTVMGAVGLSADYGGYLGNQVADKYLAGFQVNLEDEIRTVRQARQRVYCLFKGPACLRQWQLNNTRQPGSDAVGETYGLKIDRFQVGSGSQVDVAYKNGDYMLPISFGLSNNRHGLKGINALNVSYRAKIIDFDRGRKKPFCETGWKPINGFDIQKDSREKKKSELEATGNEKWLSNDLYPGTSAATGFVTIENFNLSGCEMLQPALGETRTVLLQVKYDYSSQATLYFQAMSRRNLQSNPDIQRKWKKSKTADTPVKAAVNVNSPVLFNQQTLNSRPFSVRASLETKNTNLEYKIKDLHLIKSEQVELDRQRSGGRCDFRKAENSENEDLLKLTDNADNILAEGGESERGDEWFSADNPPSFFGCQGGFFLKNTGQISPGGETLTMDVEANYTVRLNEKIDQFRVLNTRCSQYDCPLLVTMNYALQDENDLRPQNDERHKHGWKTKCTGVDAGNGCEVVKGPDGTGWSVVKLMTGGRGDKGQGMSQRLDSELERGEFAVSPTLDAGFAEPALKVLKKPDINRMKKKLGIDPGKMAFGLKETRFDKLEEIKASEEKGFAIISSWKNGERDVEAVEFSKARLSRKKKQKICKNSNSREVKFPKIGNLGMVADYSRYKTDEEEEVADIVIAIDEITLKCGSGSGSGGGSGSTDGSDTTSGTKSMRAGPG